MSYSQIGQDLYVLNNVKEPGFYIEVGAFDPVNLSNTYLLEQKGWKGLSFDIVDIPTWAEKRQNSLIKCDATTFNFEKCFIDNNCPILMDYLSWDIDYENVQQLNTLYAFPWAKYKFKVITIEHDAYRVDPSIKYAMRALLTVYGYHLDKPDQPGFPQEDWWILK